MFNILNSKGQVVETAASHLEAMNVITSLYKSHKSEAPFHAAPVK